MKFGDIVRSNRKEHKWTLVELSKSTGISVAQLSKLETNKSSPSMNSLRKLSVAFEVPMSALTHVEDEEAPCPVRDGEGFILKVGADDSVIVRYLTIKRRARMQPVVMTIPVGVDTGRSKSHPSDEFFYVIEGETRFFYGEKQSFDLKEGDFLYFEGHIPHHWQNIGNVICRILSCNDPPVI